MASIVSFKDVPLEPWPGTDEEVLEGELQMRVHVLSSSADGRNATGIWQAEPCTVRLVHPFEETFLVLEGSLEIEPAGETPVVMGPGDSIVLHEGAVSIWTLRERVTKVFSIYREGGLPGV